MNTRKAIEQTELGVIFGRTNSNCDICVLYTEDGEPVTRLDETMPTVYPVGSLLSALYEHTEGIVLSRSDAETIGLAIEE